MRTSDEPARHWADHLQRVVAAIGAGDVFTKGRDFAAWLGLVPKRSRPGTAPSSARYPGGAIATCGFCSCRSPKIRFPPIYCSSIC